uniref:hypothetical protein n=1 Tax=Acetatifactor sp. TaxID=1872090 RepID=UPI0040574F67
MNTQRKSTDRQKGAGYWLLLFPVVSLIVLVILINVAVGMVTTPSERQQINTANRFWKVINSAVEGETSAKNLKWLSQCYPDGCGLGLGEEELKQMVADANNTAVAGQKLTYQCKGVKAVEESELERYAGYISLMEGMKENDVEVTVGSWITYDVTYEGFESEINALMEAMGAEFTLSMDVLVLECNGKLGVWGVYEESSDYVYFWEE